MFLELAPQSTHQSGNVCWDTFSNVSCRVTGWVVWCDAIYQETVRMCQQLYTNIPFIPHFFQSFGLTYNLC